jgi:hypothetical protein
MRHEILDIDRYAPELQNPDITKPAGAGDVPLSNYKMIGALAAKRGEIEPKDLTDFVGGHGMTGWAPTQGHIPSGVPYLGFAREDILAGRIKNAMIIGKGSLFLGRMTNLFDGVSFVVEKNGGVEETDVMDDSKVKSLLAKALRTWPAPWRKRNRRWISSLRRSPAPCSSWRTRWRPAPMEENRAWPSRGSAASTGRQTCLTLRSRRRAAASTRIMSAR